MIRRYLFNSIVEDLKDKMIFIGGPRQVGKTTFAKNIGQENFNNSFEYLNWDNRDDRKSILNSSFKSDKKLIIFDELHKFKDWKNFVKGEYDKYKDEYKFIVTGSSRLDIFKKGGDSLLGRYHYYRLHPLSIAELLGKNNKLVPFTEIVFEEPDKENSKIFDQLYKFSGYPELYLKQDEAELRRWHNERVDRLVKEDIRDTEAVRDLSSLQILVELLHVRAASLLSINSLTEDLRVTHKTADYWVDVLERFYYHFRIYPFQNTKIRALRKEPKLYLWDWSEVKDDGHKFENFVASHLLKACHLMHDKLGYKMDLFYLRDKDQREVDFLVTCDNQPWFCVEVKNSSKELSTPLKYFREKLNIPYAFQVVSDAGIDLTKDNIRIISGTKFLSAFV